MDIVCIYCSGGGYFVNVEVAKIIIDKYEYFYKSKNILAEDLLMGYTLSEYSIVPFHLNYKNILDWGEKYDSHVYFYQIRCENFLGLE